jgi:hypothetical protein
MQTNLIASIRTTLLQLIAEHGGYAGVAAKTASLGLDYNTLWNSMNRNQNPMPEDLARALVIMKATENFEPLRIAAEFCGFNIEPKHAAPSDEHDVRHSVIELNHEVGRAGMKIETALSDGNIDDREDREIGKGLQVARNALAKTEAKVAEFRKKRQR